MIGVEYELDVESQTLLIGTCYGDIVTITFNCFQVKIISLSEQKYLIKASHTTQVAEKSLTFKYLINKNTDLINAAGWASCLVV